MLSLCHLLQQSPGWDSLSVERWTRHEQGCEFDSWQLRRKDFLLRVKFLCWLFLWCPFHPVFPQWHIEDHTHSAKTAGGRLNLKHAYTPDPTKSEWADYAVQASCGNVGTYQRKRGRMKLIKKHLANVVSACWAPVNWSWPDIYTFFSELVCTSWCPL